MTGEPVDGAALLAEHLRDCRSASAAVVMDRGMSSDEVVANLLAAGWTWSSGDEAGSTERLLGKRIRYLVAPPGATLADLPDGAVSTPPDAT